MRFMSPLAYNFLEQNPRGNTEQLLLYYIYLSQERLAASFADYFKTNYDWSPNQTRVMCHLKFQKLITMSELAALIHVSRQHMTQIVDSLVKMGLAERKYDPENRRIAYVQPTIAGKKQLDTGERRFISHLLRAISRLPEQEQTETIEAIRTVSRFLERIRIETRQEENIIF